MQQKEKKSKGKGKVQKALRAETFPDQSEHIFLLLGGKGKEKGKEKWVGKKKKRQSPFHRTNGMGKATGGDLPGRLVPEHSGGRGDGFSGRGTARPGSTKKG